MNLAKAMGLFLITLFYSTYLSGQSIFINEFMASNDQTIADENGEFDDWVEIYNAGPVPFDLGGKYVTDDLSEPTQWQIPTTNPNLTTVPAGGYLIIWFDGDEEQGALHVSPKLGGGGEQIGLYDVDGTPIDTLTYGEQMTDISEGRSPDGSSTFVKFTVPSPNEMNGEPILEDVATPQAFPIGGLYASPMTLTLASETADATIHYTTDGSEPTESSPIYNGAIFISASQVIRAKAFKNGANASEIVTNSYLINTNHTFPIVSISVDSFLFFDPATGLYPNYTEDIEIPMNVEFYEPDGTLGFNQVAEVEIHGSTSAILDQKSLAIKAKGSLGSSTIDYPVFPDEDLTKYRSLILRNSGQDWEYTMFRDAMQSSLVADLEDLEVGIETPNLDDQAYRPAIAYLNGKYWGIYNLRERSDKRYIRNRYGLDDNEIDLLDNLDEAKEGDFEAWNNLDSLLRSKSFTTETGLNELAALADLDNYMDYIIHNVFIDNTDWPGNNYLRWRERSPDGKWRWMTKDLDFAFGFAELGTGSFNSGNPFVNSLDRMLNPTFFYPNPDWSTILFQKLMENPKWKQDFVNRMADQLNVLFPQQRMLDRINEFQATYQPEIQQHNQKWENVWTWNQDIEVLRTFAYNRTDAVRDHFITSLPDVSGRSDVTLIASPADGGEIKISTVTTNQNNTPWQGTYFNSIDIPLQAIAKPGFVFSGWSTNVNSTDANATINLNGDVTITANFVPEGDSTGPLNQFISFPEIADKLTTDGPFDLIASASSGLPVSLNVVSGPATIIGNTITLNGTTGTVFIQASQAGNDQYNAASTVSRFFEVTSVILPPNSSEYCASSSEAPWQEYIANVQFSNINNASAKDSYGNYLNQTATVNVGAEYPISLTPGFSWQHHNEYFTVWIDWNQDNDFLDANEQVYSANAPAGTNGTPASPLVGVVRVPDNALLGTTRMRIVMQRAQAPEPCGDYTLGETEDYSISIINGGTTSALTINCPETISLAAPAGASAIIVDWEIPSISTDCSNGINSILQTSGSPSGSLFPIGSSIITYTVTDNCGNTANCNFEIKISPSGDYCDAIGNQPWQEYIENVSLKTINNTSFKDKYGDFTNITTTLESGSEYEIGLKPGFSFFQWDEAFQVWIDFDGNGSFADNGELVYAGIYAAQAAGTTPPTLTGTFTVPNAAQPINTRMRVAMQRNTPADACETFEFGEVEDYSIQIIRGNNSTNSRSSYLNFAAFNAGRAVELQWLTNTVDLSERFTLERSSDGTDFSSLKSIDQFGTDRIDAFFKELDETPLIGKNYYRLKQNLKDGTTTYSPIKLVHFHVDLKAITVFPNPATEMLNVQLSEYAGKASTIQLFDAYGRLQKELTIKVTPQSFVSIPLIGVANGLYYLKVQVGNQLVTSEKVLVNRLY